jgi:hypothetical protein
VRKIMFSSGTSWSLNTRIAIKLAAPVPTVASCDAVKEGVSHEQLPATKEICTYHQQNFIFVYIMWQFAVVQLRLSRSWIGLDQQLSDLNILANSHKSCLHRTACS